MSNEVDPVKIEELKTQINERRVELLATWTEEQCPEVHREGWLAWEFALCTLKERGLPEEQALMLRGVWMGKVRNQIFGTYGAIVTMLSTPTFIG